MSVVKISVFPHVEMCTHRDIYIYNECEAVYGRSMLHTLAVWGYYMTSMKDYTGITFQCYQRRVNRNCVSLKLKTLYVTLNYWISGSCFEVGHVHYHYMPSYSLCCLIISCLVHAVANSTYETVINMGT